MKAILALPCLALPALLSGCFSVPVESSANPGAVAADLARRPGASVATWHMPWQLDPISSRHGERIYVSAVEGTGKVRGTREALASVGHALPQAPGPNRTVETCRRTVAGAAAKLGATEVDAASAGPEAIDAKGHYVAPVLLRVNYRRPGGFEVREAVLTCIVDQDERIVDAYAGRRRRV